MNHIKKFLFISGTVLLPLILLTLTSELVLNTYYFFKYDTLSKDAAIQKRRMDLSALTGSSSADSITWENSLKIHPFFGYTYNPIFEGVNNHGFRTEYDFELCGNSYCLEPETDNTIVIGIFGGSFAEIASHEKHILEEKIESLGIENPIVINFAIGGHALPQSLYIFQHYRELIDIAVFIDGVNELWNFIDNNRSGGPPEYAKVTHFKHMLSLNRMSPSAFFRISQIMAINQIRLESVRLSLHPVLKESMTLHYLQRLIEKAGERLTGSLMNGIKQSYFNNGVFHRVADEHMLRFAAERWGEYHALIHKLSAEWNIADFHFLQPNIFMPHHKTLTEKEIRIFERETGNLPDYLLQGYPLLRNKISDLKRSGVAVRDLTNIYKNKKATIWIDPLHPNARGSRIVMNRVFMAIRNRISGNSTPKFLRP